MTPAEHYELAEHWIASGARAAEEELDDEVVRCLMAAQVHATLATVDPDALWPEREVVAGPTYQVRVAYAPDGSPAWFVTGLDGANGGFVGDHSQAQIADAVRAAIEAVTGDRHFSVAYVWGPRP
jgi:hypothetical protein